MHKAGKKIINKLVHGSGSATNSARASAEHLPDPYYNDPSLSVASDVSYGHGPPSDAGSSPKSSRRKTILKLLQGKRTSTSGSGSRSQHPSSDDLVFDASAVYIPPSTAHSTADPTTASVGTGTPSPFGYTSPYPHYHHARATTSTSGSPVPASPSKSVLTFATSVSQATEDEFDDDEDLRTSASSPAHDPVTAYLKTLPPGWTLEPHNVLRMDQLDRLTEIMLDDMNLKGEARARTAEMAPAQRWQVVKQHFANYEDRVGMRRAPSMAPSDGGDAYTPEYFMNRLPPNNNKVSYRLLDALRVSLTTKMAKWVTRFVELGGLNTLVDLLKKVQVSVIMDDHRRDRTLPIENELVRCLKGLLNVRVGNAAALRSPDAIQTLALSLDTPKLSTRKTTAEILAGLALKPRGHHLVLHALETLDSVRRAPRAFTPWVAAVADVFSARGLFGSTVQAGFLMKDYSDEDMNEYVIANIVLAHSLLYAAPDLDVRLHLRNQFVGAGFEALFTPAAKIATDALKNQIRQYQSLVEQDAAEYAARCDLVVSDWADPTAIFTALVRSVEGHPDGMYWLTRLVQHLACIRGSNADETWGPDVRAQYLRVIDHAVASIVLDRRGLDPSPGEGVNVAKLIAQFEAADQLEAERARAAELETKLRAVERERHQLLLDAADGTRAADRAAALAQAAALEEVLHMSQANLANVQRQLADVQSRYEATLARHAKTMQDLLAAVRGGGARESRVIATAHLEGDVRTALVDELVRLARERRELYGEATAWRRKAETAVRGEVVYAAPPPMAAGARMEEQQFGVAAAAEAGTAAGSAESLPSAPSTTVAPAPSGPPATVSGNAPPPPPPPPFVPGVPSSTGAPLSDSLNLAGGTPSAIPPPPPPPPMLGPGSPPGSPPPPPPPPPGFAGPGIPPLPPVLAKGRERKYVPPVALRPFQWDAVPVHKSLAGTVWEAAEKEAKAAGGHPDDKWVSTLGEDWLESVHAAFPARAAVNVLKLATKAQEVSVIDKRLVKALEIPLKQAKRSPVELKRALLRMDTAVISPSLLEQLGKAVPDANDIKALQPYVTNRAVLSPSDRFILEAQDVPRYKDRLAALDTTVHFADRTARAVEQLGTMHDAAHAVAESTSFRDFLQLILTVGNYLNAARNAASGGALGFKLGTLSRLASTKAADGKTNLLTFLVDSAAAKVPRVLEFVDEFVPVAPASKLSIDDVRADIKLVTDGVAAIKAELARIEKDQPDAMVPDPSNPDADLFYPVMRAFVDEATEQVAALQSTLAATAAEMDRALRMFGEFESAEPNKAAAFFALLASFASSVKDAHKAWQAAREAKERRERARAAGKAAAAAVANGTGAKSMPNLAQSSSSIVGEDGARVTASMPTLRDAESSESTAAGMPDRAGSAPSANASVDVDDDVNGELDGLLEMLKAGTLRRGDFARIAAPAAPAAKSMKSGVPAPPPPAPAVHAGDHARNKVDNGEVDLNQRVREQLTRLKRIDEVGDGTGKRGV
ncbi:Disheveled-associated activator of morphogenesis 1 [Allomyces arbusculus]|nr:Disheveled-associated activator of morphogenesis 1 [Allomyces arbusculus]